MRKFLWGLFVLVVVFVAFVEIKTHYAAKYDAEQLSSKLLTERLTDANKRNELLEVRVATLEKSQGCTQLASKVDVGSLPDVNLSTKTIESLQGLGTRVEISSSRSTQRTRRVTKRDIREYTQVTRRGHIPIKKVIINNVTESGDGYELIPVEVHADGSFKKFQMSNNPDGTGRKVLAGGWHGVECLSDYINLKVIVLDKKGRVEYETKIETFNFDRSHPMRPEKFIWNVGETAKKTTFEKVL